MTAYMIVEFKTYDTAEFARYRNILVTAAQSAGGQILAIDEAPLPLVGDKRVELIALIAFASVRDFEALRQSPEGLQLSVLRDSIGDVTVTILRDGQEPPDPDGD